MTLHETPKTHRILASIGSVTTFFAASLGVSLERITKGTGISPAALMNPDDRIPEEFLPRILRLLAKARPGHNVSLEMARVVPISFLGTPGATAQPSSRPAHLSGPVRAEL